MADSKSVQNLKKQISRIALTVGIRIRNSKGEELERLNSILLLLNQAQLVASTSENEAKKIVTLARNLKSGSGSTDESRNKKTTKRRRKTSSLNEKRKKDTTR